VARPCTTGSLTCHVAPLQFLLISRLDGNAIDRINQIRFTSALEVWWSGGSASRPQLQRPWSEWKRNSERDGVWLDRFTDMEGFLDIRASSQRARHNRESDAERVGPFLAWSPPLPRIEEQRLHFLFDTFNASGKVKPTQRRIIP
jgi:hypothetical protein